MLRVIVSVALASWLGTAALAEVEVPLTGDNTRVLFTGFKPGGKHEGSFPKLTGSARFDPADVTTLKLSVEIDMTSLKTDDEKLTKHLKSPDFFGVKDNPTSKFVSTKVEKVEKGGVYKVTGKLTMNGKTKEASFTGKIFPKADSIEINAGGKINRNDWGISYGKGKIDDMVSLNISVLAKK